MSLALWHWHIEISSKCTLKCPRCPRQEVPDTLVSTELKLDFFKQNFPKEFILKNVEKLISTYNYKKEECCLIGDSINDKIAAETNSVDFYGYNNHDLKSKSNYIDNFKKINSY